MAKAFIKPGGIPGAPLPTLPIQADIYKGHFVPLNFGKGRRADDHWNEEKDLLLIVMRKQGKNVIEISKAMDEPESIIRWHVKKLQQEGKLPGGGSRVW
jgi:hypothetical protein